MNARSVLFFALLALLVVLASSSSVAASTGVDSLSSPYVVPVPSFNYSSFAAFYTEENFDQPAAFVINMDNVTAFGACTTESPVITIADHNFTSLWVAACSYNDSLLTLDVSIFDSSCGFSNGTYINMTATAAAPSSYSPSLYPISYVLAADGRNETHGVWYTVVHCPLTPSNNESSSTGAAGVSSTGADLSSSTPSISSSYVVPVPSFNYSSFAAFYTEENFDQPAAFVINMEPLTALDSCADEKPVISLAGQSYTNVWAHQCSYNGSLLTLDVSIFNRTCGFDNTTAYVNVTATAVAPTAYSPSLYEVEYAIVADNKTTSSHWYAVVKCPSFAPADSSSSDSSVGVVIGGVVIGVIVVFIVIALLYSRRNRKTVDQTSGNTTDANQAYSRL